MALLWILGIYLIMQPQAKDRINKWIIIALFLGLAIFPGLGLLSYSVALGYAYFFHPRGITEIPTFQSLVESAHVPFFADEEEEQQPLLDVLRFANLETRRAAIASMGQHVTPGRTLLLRNLLTDPQAEIRSDASVILTRLEESLAQKLHATHEVWITDQANRRYTLELFDQYYQYAASNVLDEASQRIYFLKARDLLLQVLSEEVALAEYWYKLAQVRHQLGEDREALQNVLTALRLTPDSHYAYQLACDLAFYQRDWNTLHILAQRNHDQSGGAAVQYALQWLIPKSPQKLEEVRHG
jgi:tetratricopeptide (TPR) repeat protein